MSEKKYYTEINIARGIAVLLVLLGHSFPDAQTGITNFGAKWVFDFLYSFHMGAFFILSGFVASRKMYGGDFNFAEELMKKVKRLFIPYIVYSIITLVLKLFLNEYANNKFSLSEVWKILVGINPNGGLWYLWTLFVIFIFIALLSKLMRNIKDSTKTVIYLVIGIIAYVIDVMAVNGNKYSNVDRLLCYIIFFNLGLIIARYYSSIKDKWFNLVAGIIAILMTFALKCPGLGLSIPYIVTGLLGSYGLLSLAIAVSRKEESGLFKAYDLFGTYSYDIYLISYFVQVSVRVVLWTILGVNYWVVVAAMFILGLSVSILVSKYIIRKVGLFRKIFIGDWS